MKPSIASVRVVLSAAVAAAIAAGCGSTFSNGESKDSGADHAECPGTAPDCFNTNSSACCLVDAYGPATCNQGAWTCGAVVPPGCDESLPKCGGPSCAGAPPRCCPVSGGSCDCPTRRPFQFATCGSGAMWLCGQDEVLESACAGSDAGFGFGEAGFGDVHVTPIDGGAIGSDAAPPGTACGPKTCSGSAPICVETFTEGTSCIPPIMGLCPIGDVQYGKCCATLTFSCAARPATCGSLTLDCGCAASLCAPVPVGGTSQCERAGGDDVQCFVVQPPAKL